jgi:class 3 adenylate cyclase
MGIHGGEVVVSQEGDIRRAIGIWGDAINVAARLAHAGGVLGKPCIILARRRCRNRRPPGLEPSAPIHAEGFSREIAAYALNPTKRSDQLTRVKQQTMARAARESSSRHE